MKNLFTLIKSLFAKSERRKADKIKNLIPTKPEEQIKHEIQNPFEHHAKGTCNFIHKNKIESKKRKHAKKIRRIQKQSRIINRAA